MSAPPTQNGGEAMQRILAALLTGQILAALGATTIDAQPVQLRIGYGTAAEEQLWLLIAKPDIGRHYGKAYAIEGTRFTGSDKRAQAYEAGAIDFASSSANGVIFESDITIVPVSFSAMAQSLQSGRIDVGQFPQPFDALLRKQAKVTKIFTAKDAIPEDEELLVLIAKDRFLKSNTTAVKALLEDLTAATKFYLEKPNEARQILLDSKMVRIPSDIFLSMDDYYRDPSMRVDVATLVRMQNYQVKAGFQKKTIDVQSLVDMSYLPH
jgi:ABC-type nitrate/sulfonate/bicarbonate transport system substrate-binding protein